MGSKPSLHVQVTSENVGQSKSCLVTFDRRLDDEELKRKWQIAHMMESLTARAVVPLKKGNKTDRIERDQQAAFMFDHSEEKKLDLDTSENQFPLVAFYQQAPHAFEALLSHVSSFADHAACKEAVALMRRIKTKGVGHKVNYTSPKVILYPPDDMPPAVLQLCRDYNIVAVGPSKKYPC